MLERPIPPAGLDVFQVLCFVDFVQLISPINQRAGVVKLDLSRVELCKRITLCSHDAIDQILWIFVFLEESNLVEPPVDIFAVRIAKARLDDVCHLEQFIPLKTEGAVVLNLRPMIWDPYRRLNFYAVPVGNQNGVLRVFEDITDHLFEGIREEQEN